MNLATNAKQPGHRRPYNSRPTGQPVQHPQLFDDTSTIPPVNPYGTPQPPPVGPPAGYEQEVPPPSGPPMYGMPQQQQAYPPQTQQFAGEQFMSDPMASMAMSYGQTLADQGKDIVQKNLEKYVSTSKLKYYFAVDTKYVGKKLGLLLFPYAHTDWSIRYNQEEPVAPRYDTNAPDLYIPVMTFVTYILVAGLVFGTQDRFTPEILGLTASTALVWMLIEIFALLLMTYILQLSTALNYMDLLAYCGYKYIGMICSLIGGLLFHGLGYYLTLLWTSCSIAFFLVRSLKFAIIPHTDSDNYSRGNKRRLYMLVIIALIQPLFMWWLTSYIVFNPSASTLSNTPPVADA